MVRTARIPWVIKARPAREANAPYPRKAPADDVHDVDAAHELPAGPVADT